MSVLHRPEWRATAAGAQLPVRPVAGAFIGVSVPSGVSDITVEYVPRIQIALTWFGNVVFFALVAFAIAARRAPAASPVTTEPGDSPEVVKGY
jgi:uncharacterized membrane protein YfhO